MRLYRKKTWLLVIILTALIGEFWTTQAVAAPVRSIGSRLELFVDDYLIEKMSNVQLRLQSPKSEGVCLTFDKPWEGVSGAYTTIIKDDNIYRLYRRGGGGGAGQADETVLYAESKDGINWTRPQLGLYAVNGSSENNIILAEKKFFSHNFSPFLDVNPDVLADQRYKAIAGMKESGLVAFVSGDGIHWKKLQEEPIIPRLMADNYFDSQNVAFWSPAEQCYVCYFRILKKFDLNGPSLRSIARATSKDFIHWTEPVAMNPNLPGEHLYTSQTHPYFRAPHIYIALPTRFMAERANSTDILFMTTRSGEQHYQRKFNDAFIRPGLDPHNWLNRGNYAALNVVPTSPVEMSIYVDRRGATPHYLERMTLRTDGFVSVHADYQAGYLLTNPLTFTGKELQINFSTSAAGSIQVEIQDVDGRPIPGFALSDCSPVVGDEIKRTVNWGQGSDVSSLANTPVRLRFKLTQADLFSIRFRN